MKGRINESGLARIWQHIQNHDCAILTAFRGSMENCAAPDSGMDPRSGSVTKADNLRANKTLKATLLRKGYGVTSVDGAYIENFNSEAAREVKENSFFVANLNDDPEFMETMRRLGEAFCQDAVLLIPAGGQGAALHGTNHADFPGYGEKVPVGDFKGGEETEFLTRVGGRAFVFETYADLPRLQRMACARIADPILERALGRSESGSGDSVSRPSSNSSGRKSKSGSSLRKVFFP